jgi:dihydroneopterin aldolase
MTIELKQARFFAYHGLDEDEKKKGNDFEVSLSVTFSPSLHVIAEISSTINYVDLFEITREEMARPRDLLETLAMEIIEVVHSRFPAILHAEISITKLRPPIEGLVGTVGVTYSKDWKISGSI